MFAISASQVTATFVSIHKYIDTGPLRRTESSTWAHHAGLGGIRPKIRSVLPGTNLAGCVFPTQPIQQVSVKIRAGYDIAFQCPHAVPMVRMLTTHPSRDGDILSDQSMHFSPSVDARDYFDPYGNICTRLVAPPGLLEVRSEFAVEDGGLPMRCALLRNSGM